MTLALSLLTAVGLVVFKGSLDIMAPRQWIIYQNVSDAYITYEKSYAERISFEELTADTSPWPIYPLKSTSTIEIGKFPGGAPITATVIRTRVAGDNNLPDPSSDTYLDKLALNPSETETWQLQSHLTYSVGDDDYVKSRTIIRSQ